MKPALLDLWNGNIAPGPNCGAADTEVERLSILMDRNAAILDQVLSAEHRAILEKYIDYAEEYSNLLMKHAFCDGFRLASRLLSEALSEE